MNPLLRGDPDALRPGNLINVGVTLRVVRTQAKILKSPIYGGLCSKYTEREWVVDRTRRGTFRTKHAEANKAHLYYYSSSPIPPLTFQNFSQTRVTMANHLRTRGSALRLLNPDIPHDAWILHPFDRVCVLPTMCGADCGGAAGCDRPNDPLLIA